MAAVEKTSESVTTEVKRTPSKTKKSVESARTKPSHPATAVMVNNAIAELKERGGSSLQAIKKYISSTYKIDSNKFAPIIKKYIRASVASSALIQTKGQEASGSFKLASTAVTKQSVTKDTKNVSKSTGASKRKLKPTSKPKTKSKSPAKKVKSPAKATTKAAVKSVSKPTTKRTSKLPAKKPKAPKPKASKTTGRKGALKK